MNSASVPPPFFENANDAMHCVEACLKSILIHFGIRQDISMAELELITGFQPGKGTWQFRMYHHLADVGLKVKIWNPIDLVDFTQRTQSYLTEIGGEVFAKHLYESSDVYAAVQDAWRVHNDQRIQYSKTAPSIDIIKSELENGQVCVCHVDHGVLSESNEYEGHLVIVTEVKYDGTIALNDPGPPPRANWSIPQKKFIDAWRSPNAFAQSLLVVGRF